MKFKFSIAHERSFVPFFMIKIYKQKQRYDERRNKEESKIKEYKGTTFIAHDDDVNGCTKCAIILKAYIGSIKICPLKRSTTQQIITSISVLMSNNLREFKGTTWSELTFKYVRTCRMCHVLRFL